MKHFALIGRHLGHSYSKQYYECLWQAAGVEDCAYRLQEMENLEGLRSWVEAEQIAGFNVTAPFKEAVWQWLDDADDTARAVWAVNCVTVEHGRLTGHNTDAPAFLSSLPADGLPQGSRALVLGTGGAARAVSYALRQRGIAPTLVSRRADAVPGAVGYSEARRMLAGGNIALLVNATPVGTAPNVDSSPWPWPAELANASMVYDLTYNPSPTLLLRQAMTQGCRTKDGLEMLHRQADLSWELFQRL